jgi:hypothetical protein
MSAITLALNPQPGQLKVTANPVQYTYSSYPAGTHVRLHAVPDDTSNCEFAEWEYGIIPLKTGGQSAKVLLKEWNLKIFFNDQSATAGQGVTDVHRLT